MTFEDQDPFEPRQRKGLPPREFNAYNATLKCDVLDCNERRDSPARYCRKHYRRFAAFGHLTKRHIDPGVIWRAKARVRKLLGASMEARHPMVLAGLEGIRRLLAPGSFVHREAKHEFLARIAATADPRDVLIETVAVCLCLHRFDPEGYADPDYLATQITHRLRKLGPPRYANATGQKSLRRSKAMAGAVLDVVGPLVSLMVAALERDRKLRQARRQPKHPLNGAVPHDQ